MCCTFIFKIVKKLGIINVETILCEIKNFSRPYYPISMPELETFSTVFQKRLSQNMR